MKSKALYFLVAVSVLVAPVTGAASGLPEGKSGILGEVPFFSQRTGGWENDFVGTSGATIEEIGCAMVCTAMLAKYYGKDTDSGRLNTWLSANNGYTANGLLYWAKPAEYSGGKMQYMDSLSWTPDNWETDNDHWSELNSQLDSGYPVIVKVDAYLSTPDLETHWVLVTRREGNKYYISDPYRLTYDPNDLLSRYYDATYDNTFFAMRVYQGTTAIDCPPVVDSFNVNPGSVTLGDSFTISYAVSDDVGLSYIQLWRRDDSRGTDWEKVNERVISGTTASGSFADTPALPGTYSYGVHVGDTAGHRVVEPDPPGPIGVEVLEPSGSLRVTITPQEAIDAGAQWVRLGTTTWRDSGDTETAIPVGTYLVRFSDVAGWNTPSARWVTINPAQTTEASGEYTPATGSLRVTITPQEAIDAGAQWCRVGTTAWRNSGDTETGIPVGTYMVSFSDVAGWNTPSWQWVTIDPAQTTDASGEYTPATGSLRVTIGPQEAIDAGAQWVRLGTTIWHDSGDTETGIPVGTYVVSFSDVAGWNTPSWQWVTIDPAQTTEATGEYTPATGSLRVTITPQEAIDAGAQWRRVDQTTWRGSGDTESGIPVGTCMLVFSDIAGWNKPSWQWVTIEPAQTTDASGAYVVETPFEIFEIVEMLPGTVRLTWSSRPGARYTICSCFDLASGVWEVESVLSSEGEITEWTDPSPLGEAKFYRIEAAQ